MNLPLKKRAPSPRYVSPSQMVLEGFETPFTQKLDANNRWVVLSKRIPWDKIASVYNKQMSGSSEGRPPLSPRLVIGAVIIKHINNWDDRETILQIQENMYLQYFVGYSSFTIDPIFDPSLFVDIRKRMGEKEMNSINEEIVRLHVFLNQPQQEQAKIPNQAPPTDENSSNPSQENLPQTDSPQVAVVTHHGRMITDATACPQDIAFPTDLNLLNDAREKSEQIIDIIYCQTVHKSKKPRTYRNNARREYLNIAKNKNKSKKAIRKAVGKQLNFLKRNIKSIESILDSYDKKNQSYPLVDKQMRYFWIIQTLYQQQHQMHKTYTHSVEDRIVSIHQPHIRPIVRGKTNAKVEFGAKINVTIANGFSFLDDLSWDAFNEGVRLLQYVEKYKTRFGFYPKEVLADQIYCNRENRKKLQELGIKLLAKPLGRPKLGALKEYVSPGARNPIEGKFGQGKNAYGLGRIKARLKDTSQSWIASIILVLNLVKLAGLNLYCLLDKIEIKIGNFFLDIKHTLFRFIPNSALARV